MSVEDRGSFPVAINGRRYLADLSGYQRSLLPWQRQPVDDGQEAGQNTLNTYGPWSRTQTDWTLGGGQEHFDREDSSRRRAWVSEGLFLSERGAKPSIAWEAVDPTLTGDVLLASSGSSATAAQRLYAAAGTAVKQMQSFTGSFSAMTYGGGTIKDMVAAGGAVYVTDGTNIYRATIGLSTFSSWSSVACDRLWYANGRLLVAQDAVGSVLKEVGAGGLQVGNDIETDMVIEDVVGTPFGIYVGGWDFTDGSVTGFVKRIPILTDDGSLGSVVSSSVLPETEKVLSLAAVANYAMIGTNRGLRLGRFDGAGFLTYGPWVDPNTGTGAQREGSAVTEIVSIAEAVWFLWEAEDGSQSGLGRTNLSEFVASTTPSFYVYESSTTASYTALTSYWDPNAPQRSRIALFARDGILRRPVITGSSLYSLSGVVETGWITYDIPDSLVPLSVSVRHSKLPAGASVAVSLYADDGTDTATLVGTSDTTGETEATFDLDLAASERFRLKFEVTNGSADDTPVELQRWTMRALPIPTRTTRFVVPLVLRERVTAESHNARPMALDPRAEMDALMVLADARTVVSYEEGDTAYNVVVDDVALPEDPTREWTRGNSFPQGTVLVSLLTVD